MIPLLWLLSSFSLNQGVSEWIPTTKIAIRSFKNCDDKKDLANTYENIVIHQEGPNKMVLHGTFVIRKEVTAPASTYIKINKCPSKENKDLCEYYLTYKTEDICKELNIEGSMWADVFSKLKPIPATCPLRTGNYTLEGLNIETSSKTFFGVGVAGGFWTVRAWGKTKADSKFWFCTLSDVDIIEEAPRKRRKKAKKH